MVAFSASNIGYNDYSNLLGPRIEGLVLRVRLVVYQIILVSLNQFPILAAILIIIIELTHMIVYCYYSIRYRYARDWLLLISKINIGLSINIICLIAIYSFLTNLDKKLPEYVMASWI